MGVCYAKGEGVSQNVEQALYWFQKAAEQGDVDAQNILSEIQKLQTAQRQTGTLTITASASKGIQYSYVNEELQIEEQKTKHKNSTVGEEDYTFLWWIIGGIVLLVLVAYLIIRNKRNNKRYGGHYIPKDDISRDDYDDDYCS